MATLRLSPTEVGVNSGSWYLPENILGPAKDNVCGVKGSGSAGNYNCYLKTFRDADGNPPAIPAGSTITKITLGQSARYSYVSDIVWFWYIGASGSLAVADCADLGTDCAGTYERSNDFTSGLPTVAEINNETYQTYIGFYKDGAGISSGRADNVFIIITYTPPSVPSGVVDGLVQAD